MLAVAATCARVAQLIKPNRKIPAKTSRLLSVVDTEGPSSDLNCHQLAKTDSESAIVIAAWEKLARPIRAGIIAMVKAAR
jgi:hypothetical protein